jgi:hypothetical protein
MDFDEEIVTVLQKHLVSHSLFGSFITLVMAYSSKSLPEEVPLILMSDRHYG